MLNRLTSRQFTGLTQARIDFAYDAAGRMIGETRYNDLSGTLQVGSSSLTYDAADRLTQLRHLDALGSPIASYVYAYDAASRLASETINGVTKTYSYDDTNQLTSDNGAGYSYDDNGNRTNTCYVTGPNNQLTTDGVWNYSYDAEGNLVGKTSIASGGTWVYAYDLANHMTSAEERDSSGTLLVYASYAFDVFGNRIEKSVTRNISTTTTKFAYNDGVLWADLSASGSLTTRYLSGDQPNQWLASVDGSGVVSWFLADHLGSIRDIAVGTGIVAAHYDYNAWGTVTVSTGLASRLLYAGYEYNEESGLYYVKARVYDPATGRFTSQDPLGLTPDVNTYRYVGNGPTNGVDPWGLWVVSRNKNNRQAEATSEKNDTVATLGQFIGLSSKEFQNWLAFLPFKNTINLANGKEVTLIDLKPQDAIHHGEKVLVPNSITTIWAGDLAGFGGKKIVGWEDDIVWLQQRGFSVGTIDIGPKVKLTGEALAAILGGGAKKKELHGVYVWGHGHPVGFGSRDPKQLSVTYEQIENALKYHLGFVLLNVCHGGWSKEDKNVPLVPGGKIAAGGKDLISDSKGAKFYGVKVILVPGVHSKHPKDILKPGEQGTNK